MARVETGCRDCKRCTNATVAEAGRKLGKAAVSVGTLGMSNMAMAFTKNCRSCGHKMSLHGKTHSLSPVGPSVDVQGGTVLAPIINVQAPAAATAPPAVQPDVLERLAKLDQLRAAGFITDAEHQAQRQQIIGSL